MADIFKTQGAFSWFELTTTDPQAAKNFYSQLFGWDTEDMSMEDMAYIYSQSASAYISPTIECSQALKKEEEKGNSHFCLTF